MPHSRTPTQSHLRLGLTNEVIEVQHPWTAPTFRVALIREGGDSIIERASMDRPEVVAATFAEHLQFADREHFVVMLLCTQNRLIGLHTASIGTLNTSLVCPREVFKAAILANAASVIVGHNHPSGDPSPSPEDQATTHDLRRAGRILDIPVLDHIIVGDRGRFCSLKRMGVFDSLLDLA